MSGMGRREFVALLGGAAAAWPLAARGQRNTPVIGFLGAATPATTSPWTTAFGKRLRELGWIEGRNVAIEYRFAGGRSESLSDMASELVRLNVDVIVTHSTVAVVAAKRATSVIPIVFANAGDPVGSGLVASLAHPGGNVTGLSIQGPDTVGKRLDLMREVVPGLRRLTIMGNVSNSGTMLEMREVETAARALGLEASTSELRQREDISPAFQALTGRTDAVYVAPDALANVNRARISAVALGARLPTMSSIREYVEVGMLMSYGANFPDLWRRAAEFTDSILRGRKPADIPVEQPIKFDLIINLKTAKALGIEVPPTLVATADEVIE
jgi:putative tryptophan/tyrosine transport system substrate-binding protein